MNGRGEEYSDGARGGAQGRIEIEYVVVSERERGAASVRRGEYIDMEARGG